MFIIQERKMSILEIKGLTKELNKFILNNINLELPKGYVLGYVGQNGAGKTTTIKLITEQYKHDIGTIRINGLLYHENPIVYKSAIGYVADECYFPSDFTVDMIESTLSDCYYSFNKNKFENYLKRWNLPKGKKIREFSKGMKVRLMFTTVLSRETQILILDEATSGLDPVVRKEIIQLIQEYVSDGEKSVLFSTHIMDDLEAIADYIYFINNGQMVLKGVKDELLEEFVVVKGGINDLTKELKKRLIGIQQSSISFEGLLKSKNLEFTNNRIIVEKATINQIIIFYIEHMGVKSI